jgi:hypothetical protein
VMDDGSEERLGGRNMRCMIVGRRRTHVRAAKKTLLFSPGSLRCIGATIMHGRNRGSLFILPLPGMHAPVAS